MEFLFLLAVLLLSLAVTALWISRRGRRAGGLPPGRVISADTGAWKRQEKPLYDPQSGLTGRPDYLVEQNGAIIPVEVKSGWAPSDPHPGHLYQLAAYCLLVERSLGSRPPYGILHYRNRTFAIDYTAALEEELIALVGELHAARAQQRRTAVDRSHDSPARCARCGYRDTCDQRLK